MKSHISHDCGVFTTRHDSSVLIKPRWAEFYPDQRLKKKKKNNKQKNHVTWIDSSQLTSRLPVYALKYHRLSLTHLHVSGWTVVSDMEDTLTINSPLYFQDNKMYFNYCHAVKFKGPVNDDPGSVYIVPSSDSLL